MTLLKNTAKVLTSAVRITPVYSSLTLNFSVFGPTPLCTNIRVSLIFRFNNGKVDGMHSLTCFEQEAGPNDFLRSLSTSVIV